METMSIFLHGRSSMFDVTIYTIFSVSFSFLGSTYIYLRSFLEYRYLLKMNRNVTYKTYMAHPIDCSSLQAQNPNLILWPN